MSRSNDIDVTRLSDVALQSIVALQDGTEIAHRAQNELKARQTRGALNSIEGEQVNGNGSTTEPMAKEAPRPPNMPSDEPFKEMERNLNDTITRMRNSIHKGETL